MPRKSSSILNNLSTADLKRMLAARERIDVLEAERKRLAGELGRVEKELERLLAGGGVKSARVTRKKTTRKKAAGKATRKKVTRRTGSAKASGKKAGRRKAPRKKAVAGGKPKLEDVVLGVLQKNGAPMPFKDLFTAIVKGKLFASKSKNFDNVLRRTLSTSKKVKAVSRGIYGAA